ncbi:MAG: helix-turn-helix domain-containing protein [Oscillospiraceae bacterium]|nr:helix-turn-helix domain-containing protein [Oscillospiraceae bacterium]
MPKVKKDKEAMQKRGDILLDLRKKRNIKQSTVADILGISQQAYLKYEHGEADPTIDALIVLSDFYNVSIEYLLGLEKIKEPDVLTRLVQEFNLTEIEKVIVQAYIAINPKEREKFIKAIENVVKQQDAESNSTISPIQQTTNESPLVYCGTVGEELERRKREEKAIHKDTA